MIGTKIQQENGKVKYFYDYPENREVSKHITYEDRLFISAKTGFSLKYVSQWCSGIRRNRRIEEMAKQIARINKAKESRLRKLTIEN